ncbi:MAG: T9SS type A sorting domain-containing protein [Candidatus Marinimicrobia bacterium]|nr:T9SS type A sorting domain-containing protein [Candidatus Neomarinimicrobiota bacterium]
MRLFIFTSMIPLLLLGQWERQSSGLPNDWHTGHAIDAADENNVVISIHDNSISHVYKSQNGGNDWSECFSSDSISFIDISIIDENHIWGCAWPAYIYSTTDGCSTWVRQFSDTTLTDFMNYIEMFDVNNGITMGDGVLDSEGPAIFLKTTDGGLHWESVNDSAFGDHSANVWRRIDFVSPDVGYFFESGSVPQYLFKTTNGGYNWTQTNYPDYARLIKFYDENIGLTIPRNDEIYRTIDGGESWEWIECTVGNPLDIEFSPDDPAKVWAAVGVQTYFSGDTGRTWAPQEMAHGYYRNSNDIVFVNDSTGWVIKNGRVFYTSNGGGTLSIDPKIIPHDFRLDQNYPNPFNPSTQIPYALPNDANVIVTIYDVIGRQVRSLVQENKPAGYYTALWNATNDLGFPVSAGIYIYSIQAGDYRAVKKMILMK